VRPPFVQSVALGDGGGGGGCGCIGACQRRARVRVTTARGGGGSVDAFVARDVDDALNTREQSIVSMHLGGARVDGGAPTIGIVGVGSGD
jgi:hypothetical protein